MVGDIDMLSLLEILPLHLLEHTWACLCVFFVFFFSSRRRHTRWSGDWSSDVCSSDLSLTSSTFLAARSLCTNFWDSRYLIPSATWNIIVKIFFISRFLRAEKTPLETELCYPWETCNNLHWLSFKLLQKTTGCADTVCNMRHSYFLNMSQICPFIADEETTPSF